MRRFVATLLVLAAAIAAGAGVYTAYASDRDYRRLIALGDRVAAEDRTFEALEAYSGAIALRPDAMLAHLRRGMTYREAGELAAALKDLRRASELDPTATMPLELLGDTMLSLERFDRAAERYETYLSLDDRSAPVWYKLGLARYRAGKWAAAIDPLQRAVTLDKSLAEAHFLLGLCRRDEGHTSLARASLETATQLAPGLTGPREALAGLYGAVGDSARAIDQLEALAALDPVRPDRFVALGLAHARARRHEAAVLILSRAVERFPTEPKVYAALGRIWLDAAENRDDTVALEKAIAALSTAASQAEVTSETLTDLGHAWLLAGDAQRAERVLREAVTRLPLDPDAFTYLASLAGRAGRIQEARDALVRYATLVGDAKPLASVATRIADYSLRLGEARTALRWIDRAIDDGGLTPALADLRQRAELAAAPPPE